MNSDSDLLIEAIPAFQDNYLWAISRAGMAVIVDPGDATPVLNYLQRKQLKLAAVLITHHHADHIGGLGALLQASAPPQAAPGIPVYGPPDSRITAISHNVNDADVVSLPMLQASFQVIAVPGHTRSHIAYYGHGSLFCGDTLFGGGCGRLFEGTPQQMLQSLKQLAALPGDTSVYCAHEYTLSNLRFALAVDPDNRALIARQQRDSATRDAGLSTIPSSIALELATNPFLRCSDAALIHSASQHAGASLSSEVDVFTCIRDWKNSF